MTPPSAPRRVFIVGTDTDVGKTEVTAALLRSLLARGRNPVAYKPAISGPAGPHDDLGRLLAAMPGRATREQIHRFAYPEPLAPGVAQDPRPFVDPTPPPHDAAPLAAARAHLEALEAATKPDLTIIEGAGGLLVPMPGGSWLDAWIPELRARPLVVGRLGLGTLNHTLLTLEALERRGIPASAFVLSDTLGRERDDPSTRHNRAILEARAGIPCLGVLPHRETGLGMSPQGDLGWIDLDAFEDLYLRA